VSGGAIYIFGALKYHVLDSAFLTNAVAPATWAQTASYALILSTAQAGAEEQRSAMWSIDDGPVFGLSTEECGVARQASAQGIDRGLAPSWPGSAPCANDTVYHSLEVYTHSLKLAEGDHVLHLGVFARDANIAAWAGGGKIEVAGLLDPMFPVFDDDRQRVRYPPCANDPGYPSSCPSDEAFWVDVSLHVAVGKVRRPSRTTGWVKNVPVAEL
jgi:hypothetical protein